MKDYLKTLFSQIKNFVVEHLKLITADTLLWMSSVVMHFATLPGLIAVITGISDTLPPLEIVLFIWTALSLLFARALLLKNVVNTITIGVGFIAQAVLMAFILFK